MQFSSEVISLEVENHLATVWLDRPERRNAMGKAFWEDLPVAMASAGNHPGVRVVIIAARGPSFSVGLDLLEFADLAPNGAPSSAAQAKAFLPMVRGMQAALSSVADCPKPVIAAVHGHCIGGGMDLITAADIRVASADSLFSVRETKLAIVADVGTLQRLPRIVGPGYAAELSLTGMDVDAARAKEIGLVNDIYEDAAQTLKAAQILADEIAGNSPLVVEGTKHILAKSADMSVADGLDYVALWNAAFLRSNDLVEAMQAFAEKRSPEFRGE